MQMKTVNIGFSKTRLKLAPMAWLIRWVEKTEFCHTYIKFTNSNLKSDLYYQASGSKVNFVGSHLFNKKNKVLKEFNIELTDEQYYRILDKAIDLVGQPYSLPQLAGILIVTICKLFGKTIKNPFGGKGYICSEIVGGVLVELFDLKIDDVNSITPKDIYAVLENKIEGLQ